MHAIVLVESLEDAQLEMEAMGFAVEVGGQHPARGTANLIVPEAGSTWGSSRWHRTHQHHGRGR